jgi:hypothetical protein
LLVGLVFGFGSGLSRGWIELRWGRMLDDLGVPYVSDPGADADRRSSAREAR